MYHEYAFGAAAKRWDHPELVGHVRDGREELIAWLESVHDTWRSAAAGVGQEELDELRPAHWGEQVLLYTLISKMVLHDVYYAGEINHLRAQLMGEDRWPWE